jgi:hypothetical protein
LRILFYSHSTINDTMSFPACQAVPYFVYNETWGDKWDA